MLEIDGLVKHYGPVTALDDASFVARRGRLTGFLGPNGSGKTTTMRCVFGLVRPEAGETRWDGRVIGEDDRLRFGYMPEQRGLYPRMRVREQLTYFAQTHGLDGKMANAATDRWLERFGLADRAKGKLEDLSHGNQQRVQLAAALVHDPELLVLDEPFSGLDPLGMSTMAEVLRERAAAGVSVLFSSHQLDLVEDICEDVVIIARGRIAAQGSIGELRAASDRRHLDIELAGARGDWLADLPAGVEVVDRQDGQARLLVSDDVELDAILATVRRHGEVRRFAYQPPTLSDLFMELVAAPTSSEAGAGDAASRADSDRPEAAA